MHRIRGKFHLVDCSQQKSFIYEQRPDGSYDPERKKSTAALRVKLQAVVAYAGTGESNEDFMFGQATPYGSIEATIANPQVTGPLLDLWTRYIKSDDSTYPTFYVDLIPVEEG